MRAASACLLLVMASCQVSPHGSPGPSKASTVVLALSNIASQDVSDTSAVITWSTDELATSEIEYGLDTTYGTSTPLYGLELDHLVTLSGLQPGTTYHFRVKSQDAAGNVAESDDASFTTTGGTCGAGTCPPVCGDGVCTAPETCSSCPQDCGACSGTPSGANYTQIQNDQPMPADFRPFSAAAPWNHRLPDSPQNVDAANTALIQEYAGNSGPQFWQTESDDTFSTCSVPGCGLEGYPVFVAALTDPAVTVDCSDLNYGCSLDTNSGTVSALPGTFHIPANARPGCTDENNCGDMNLAIIQPDGSELEIYGCAPQRDWVDGDVIGRSGNCGGGPEGLNLNDVVTGNGLNTTISGGDNFLALDALYNEVVPPGAVINHALEIRVSCTTGAVSPGTGAGDCEQAGGAPGIPSGTLFQLTLSHGQIDDLINQGTYTAFLRPLLYAMHDYGAYVLDTGGAGDHSFAYYAPPRLESAAPWLRNGGTNPWVPWFQAQGAQQGVSSNGATFWGLTVNLMQPIAGSLQVLSVCYAQGTCNDSIP